MLDSSPSASHIISSRDLAQNLHSRAKLTVKHFNLDPYNYKTISTDTLIDSCLEYVKSDDYARSTRFKDAPSAIKDRYTSKYWRHWNHDLKVLQHADHRESRSLNKSVQDSKKKCISRRKNEPRGLPFGQPKDMPTLLKYDKPMNKSIEETVKETMIVHDIPLTSYKPGYYDNVDPYCIGRARIKGGRFNQSI